MKHIALILAGCGNKDGTEITEAVSLIIGLSRLGAELSFFAPNQDFAAVNFLNNSSIAPRNAMAEAARITRSKMKDLATLKVDGFDALVFPGGFGAASNLSNWATKGAACEVLPEVRNAISAFYEGTRPIAAVCVAPVLLAKVLGSKKITVTLGNDPETITEIKKTGALHEICPVSDYITDRDHKIITSPAYMYGNAAFHEVFDGIQGLTQELMEMA